MRLSFAFKLCFIKKKMFVVFVSVSKIDDYKTIRYLFNSEENLMLMKKRPKTVATNVVTTFR